MLDYEKALKYNRSSLLKYNWTPSWFGGEALDSELIDLICKFQEENGLGSDGLVGPTTYRRILADALSKEESFKLTLYAILVLLPKTPSAPVLPIS